MKKKFARSGSMVVVYWLDAWYCEKELEPEEHEPLALKCLGHVLLHNQVGIKLAMELGVKMAPRQIKFIPSGMIHKVVPVK